ncbi:MAG: ABC transporter ATP-binding protein [Bacteroidales bacterium]|nr:ABC transporter ATP-binding protein [Bacteroidales bacterium]MDD3908066.1 ABC transporter ATP-binding protein [Bacteroidales bacterium]
MIELKNMNFAYSKKKKIFEDLSLTIEGGHIYGLLGKNGAGKTTLLKLMTGLRFPQSGSSTVFGIDTKKRSVKMLEEIYFLPEEIWLPDVQVDGYLKMYANSYPKFDHELFKRCLTEFEINPEDKMKKMSFGQRKKVAISFALSTQCKILIMDEPTNGLDIPSKGQFRKLAAEVISDDRCIILSTHQVRDLESLIDTVIILDESRILLNNTIEQICNKLLFKTLMTLEGQNDVIYSEFTPRGFLAVTPNMNGMDSKVDLEVLFNMTTQNPNLIKQMFNH